MKYALPTTPASGIEFALGISIVLTILKAIIGFTSGSLAILGSALDSLMDIFVSGVNVTALKLSERVRSRDFTYGLGKVQGFAAIFEGIVVLSSGVFLGYHGILNFIAKKAPEVTSIEIIIMLVAIVGTSVIMWNFLRISKLHNSLLIKADALHYSSDLYMNGGILIALIASKYLGLWWCDSVFALGIGLWILSNALPIIGSGISMLLDRSLDPTSIEKIEKMLLTNPAIESFHYLKTRKSWDDIFIEAHIVFRDKTISLRKAHDTGEILENALRKIFPGSTITLHLDTEGLEEGE